MNELLEKLKIFEDEYKKLMSKLSDPEITSKPGKIKEYGLREELDFSDRCWSAS